MAGRGIRYQIRIRSRWVRWLGGCWDRADDEPADWLKLDVQVAKEIPVCKFFCLWKTIDENWGPDWIQDTYQDYDVDERIGSAKSRPSASIETCGKNKKC